MPSATGANKRVRVSTSRSGDIYGAEDDANYFH